MLRATLLLSLLVIGCLIISDSSALPQGGRRCNNPGGTFYDGCNTCGCSPEGYVTFCTLRACIDGPIPQG